MIEMLPLNEVEPTIRKLRRYCIAERTCLWAMMITAIISVPLQFDILPFGDVLNQPCAILMGVCLVGWWVLLYKRGKEETRLCQRVVNRTFQYAKPTPEILAEVRAAIAEIAGESDS